MKIGIIGTGWIAGKLAETMQKMEQVTCWAVGSRSIDRAKTFAGAHMIEKAYGSYTELVQDDQIELIYIGTPHSEHFENAKLAIEHGKPVLCEKAFMANGKQAREIVALAEAKKVFLAEAIWTRYMPSRKMIDDIIASGEIGEIISLSANLGYELNNVPRMTDPRLAGGALLDVGVYPLHFANMFMGDEVVKVTSSCTKTDTGVDELNSMIIEYSGKRMATLHSGMLGVTDQYGIIHGTQGFLIAKNINNIDQIEIYTSDRKLKRVLAVPAQITGYEYQLEACRQAIADGRLSCEEAPLAQSIHIMELTDTLRKQWGVRYPFE